MPFDIAGAQFDLDKYLSSICVGRVVFLSGGGQGGERLGGVQWVTAFIIADRVEERGNGEEEWAGMGMGMACRDLR